MYAFVLLLACFIDSGDALDSLGWYQNPLDDAYDELRPGIANPRGALATYLIAANPALRPSGRFATLAHSPSNGNRHRMVSKHATGIGRPFPLSMCEDSDDIDDDVQTVFCNREIDLGQIDAIGFDMDHTLAVYGLDFDLLAFEGAKRKLVEELGYPSAVMDFKYNATRFMRGLVIEKSLGNFLKIDRYKYVKVASHGTKVLSGSLRKDIYRPTASGTRAYTETDFTKMDTLFQIVDAELFAQLVDLKDSEPDLIEEPYEEMYKHVRKAVDLCHRDGTIKKEVEKNPALYIKRDPDVVPMLQKLRKAGKKVFLLTNSEWDYTNVVMNHLWGNEPDARDLEWTSLFDIVICMASKPKFLQDASRSLYRIRTNSGDLLEPIVAIDSNISKFLSDGNIFHGGNYQDLHKMLELESGERLLYVGDHMYADVTRTKRTLGWRTCLIIPELEAELAAVNSKAIKDTLKEMRRLHRKQLKLDENLDTLLLQSLDSNIDDNVQAANIAAKQLATKIKFNHASSSYHSAFHEVWGQLFKAGYVESLFGKQVATYACIYTSSVGNLRTLSPYRHFRPGFVSIPHED